MSMELSVQGSLIRLTNVQIWQNGVWVNAPTGTTCSVSLTDSSGTAVPNATGIAMNLDPVGNNNNFSLILASNITLTAGSIYYVTVTVTYGGVSVPIRNKFRASYPAGNSTPA